MFLDCSFAISLNPPGRYGGLTVADFDGDGLPELFVANSDGPNRLLKWLGGALRDLVQPQLADPARPTLGAAAADLDGDGREEVYLLTGTPYGDRLFDSQLDGVWIDLFEHPKHSRNLNTQPSRAVAAIDRRGTGRYGFVVANAGPPLQLLELTTANQLVDLAPALGMIQPRMARGIVVGPIASHRSDIFCTAGPGANLLFRNTGVGTFLEVATEHHLDDHHEQNAGVILLDAAESGRFDLCWASVDGPHRVFVGQESYRFRNLASPALAMLSDTRTVIVADFDNDGFLELLFVNCREPNRLFRQSGENPREWHLTEAEAATAGESHSVGATVADLDGDGRLELVIANQESDRPALQLFKAPANNHHWLRIAPRTRFGAPARGAVVQLQAAGRVQSRVICGGSGLRCQMEPVAHFGLGHVSNIDRITITWPDEATLVIPQPDVRQTLVVNYPGSRSQFW